MGSYVLAAARKATGAAHYGGAYRCAAICSRRLAGTEFRPTLWLLLHRKANILDDHEQMARVGGRWDEPKMMIESDSLLVLGMNGERADADQVGNLKRAPERVEQQSGPKARPCAFV